MVKKNVLTKDDFANMTEEEKIEWAVNHTPTTLKRTTLISAAQLKAPRLKELYKDREKKRRRYVRNKDAVWSAAQREKRKLLLKYNVEYRERKAYDAAMRAYRRQFSIEDKWLEKYRKKVKPNLDSYAQTYSVKDRYEEYALGFSLESLIKLMPIGKIIVQRLLDNDVLPPPVREGYLLQKTTVATTATLYYTYEEASIILEIWKAYWRKARGVSDKNKELWLKKNFWKKLIEYRNE